MDEKVEYKIEVTKIVPREKGDDRPIYDNHTIYEQTVESLNLQAVIVAVNHPEYMRMVAYPEKKDD